MKQNWMKWNGKIWYFLLVFTFLAPSLTFSDEQLIKEYYDLIANRQSAAWVDLSGNALALEKDNPGGDTVGMVTIVDEGRDYNGEEPASVLQMKAVPKTGKAQFGVEGRYTISLPAKKFYQFQGFAEAAEGRGEGLVLSIAIRQKNEKGDWAASREISGQDLGFNEYGRDVTAFVFDMSDWAGQEIQLSLVMKIDAAYSNVVGKESWRPAQISSHWDRVRIVQSAFRVVLGEPEEATEIQYKGKTLRNLPSESRIQSVTAYPTSAEELILNGTNTGTGGDWHLKNPGESGVSTTYIPANGNVPGHFVAYTTSMLYPTDIIKGASNAYPRVIDFRNQTSKNMGNASRTEILNASYVDSTNNAAQMVIWPDSATSDELTITHVTFPSVYSSNYSYFGTTINVLHAFMHVEDSDQNDDGVINTQGTYEHIGYSRSRAGYEDFCRQFTKTNHSAGNAIITYVSPEESISMANKMYGCGGASVLRTDDYYYMIYHVRPIGEKTDGYDVPYASGIAIARATRTAIDNWAYPYNSNPWAKYKQIVSATTSELNWGQPGNGGVESILWNSVLVNGLRSQLSKTGKLWRAFPVVSYNTYLDTYYNDQTVLLCKGGIGDDFGTNGFVIHTSSNLLEWSDFIILMVDELKPPSGNYITNEYPTLIGYDATYGGYSGQTCEYNKLYYQKDVRNQSKVAIDCDLYRRPLRFQVQ